MPLDSSETWMPCNLKLSTLSQPPNHGEHADESVDLSKQQWCFFSDMSPLHVQFCWAIPYATVKQYVAQKMGFQILNITEHIRTYDVATWDSYPFSWDLEFLSVPVCVRCRKQPLPNAINHPINHVDARINHPNNPGYTVANIKSRPQLEWLYIVIIIVYIYIVIRSKLQYHYYCMFFP